MGDYQSPNSVKLQ